MVLASKLERFVHVKLDLIFLIKVRGKCKVLYIELRLHEVTNVNLEKKYLSLMFLANKLEHFLMSSLIQYFY
jgi:hypothetical protein